MRFLIDECLHTSLVEVANQAGYEAYHVVHFGLSGSTDHMLMKRVREREFIFVTNNARDFLQLFACEPLHPGLIIIVPNVVAAMQHELFRAALQAAEANEPLNAVIRVNWLGHEVEVEVFELSARGSGQRACEPGKMHQPACSMAPTVANRSVLRIRDRVRTRRLVAMEQGTRPWAFPRPGGHGLTRKLRGEGLQPSRLPNSHASPSGIPAASNPPGRRVSLDVVPGSSWSTIADDGVLCTRGALGAIAASPEVAASRLYDSDPEWNSLGRSCNLTLLSPIYY